jgi:Rrf2 family protein
VNISAKTEYACIAVLELAARQAAENMAAEPVRIRDIADRHGIPSRFLVQILLQLKAAGLVASVRGATGGYRLARAAERISVAQVIGAIEGPIGITACGIADDDHDCDLTDSCQVRGNWQLINRAIHGALDANTLAARPRAPHEKLVSLGRGYPS